MTFPCNFYLRFHLIRRSFGGFDVHAAKEKTPQQVKRDLFPKYEYSLVDGKRFILGCSERFFIK
jgi:hypothetical protein